MNGLSQKLPPIVAVLLTSSALAAASPPVPASGGQTPLDELGNLEQLSPIARPAARTGDGAMQETAANEEANDLITRLRGGFSLRYEDQQRIEAARDGYLRHPDYLQRVFTRAQRYMPYIVEELKRRELPLEFALLPIIESAYDPFAYSHGRAAGLWQMIPGTAKRFGIRQNWWYDGRRDVLDSTRAALDYLEYLHALQDGDWLNAIASYNAGEGRVLKARRKNRAQGRPEDFWNLKLPRETSLYVPKLLALVDIVRDPAAFGIELPAVRDEPQFAVTEIGSQLDLALAASLAGVDVDTVYAYNPGFNRWSTDPGGPHRLALPVGAAPGFKTALAAVPARERVRWRRHKVRRGEAISQIAKRYRTSVASIRKANELRSNTIRAGHYLLIPVATKPLAAYSQSADARLKRQQNRQRDGRRVEHVVARGESFWSIGRRYAVSMRQLAAWNGMAPGDTLPTGRKLLVWTASETAPRSAPGSTIRRVNYTVRSGDSLSRIARRFRVSIQQIARWNDLDSREILRPGQRLRLYVDVSMQSS